MEVPLLVDSEIIASILNPEAEMIICIRSFEFGYRKKNASSSYIMLEMRLEERLRDVVLKFIID